jgi:hypothetical protein
MDLAEALLWAFFDWAALWFVGRWLTNFSMKIES